MSGDERTPRERILAATADLLAAGGRDAVSTRSVSARAAVQPQTIYRHFGDMAGLLEEVARLGFAAYQQSKEVRTRVQDPVDDLREAWDLHVRFGLEHPALYKLMYGNPDPARRGVGAEETEAILRELIDAVARAGRLRIAADEAASLVGATGVGVVLTLLGSAADARDRSLSARTREAVIAALVDPPSDPAGAAGASGAAAAFSAAGASAATWAISLRAALGDSDAPLTPGERALLDELLERIAANSH